MNWIRMKREKARDRSSLAEITGPEFSDMRS